MWFIFLESLKFQNGQKALSSVQSAPVTMLQTEMPDTKYFPPEYHGPSYEETIKIRNERLTPNIVSYYKKPLLIHSGKMQWLFDHTGRRYLDMFGGIVTVSVGHCHP